MTLDGIDYLVVASTMAEVTVEHALGITDGYPARLTSAGFDNIVPLCRPGIPDFLSWTGDLGQEAVLEWIAENVSHEWSVKVVRDEESFDDTVLYAIYGFANAADAVACKLRWSDWSFTPPDE